MKRRVVAGMVAAALVAGSFAAGGAVRTWGGALSLFPSASAPSSSSSPPALRIFDRPAADDGAERARAAAIVGRAFAPASLRKLSFQVRPGALLFAARDRQLRACLIAVIVDDTYAAACSTDQEFARTPIVLSFLTPPTFSSYDQGTVVLQVTAEWTPEGASTGFITTRGALR